jgi:hypothetical protein
MLTVPLRPCLGALTVLLLAVAMAWTTNTFTGTYAPLTMTAVLAAGLVALAACLLPPRAWQFPPVFGRAVLIGACLFLAAHMAYRVLDPDDHWAFAAKALVGLTALAVAAGVALSPRAPASFATALAAALALLLSGEAIFCLALRYDLRDDYLRLILGAAPLGFGLTASLLVHLGDPAVRHRFLFGGQVLLLLAAGALLRFAAAVVAPDPQIDVYRAQDQGAAYLLRGENPYAGKYMDKDEYEDKGSPFYPPLPLLVGVPFRAVGLDVRLGNAACDLVAALALLAAARDHRLLGALLAAAYLNFPIAPFIIEEAWYEPMIAAPLGAGLVLAARGWRLGYFLLGVGLTGKQYGVVLLPVLLKALRGRRLALLLSTALAGAVIVLPFFLWDRHAFLDRVLHYHLNLPIRTDALTLQAAAKQRFDVALPRWLLRGAALLLIGLLAWRTPSRGPSPAPWLAASLIVFCLCHNQAFPNYYYLCGYLMLLGLADWFGHDAAVKAPGVDSAPGVKTPGY